MKLQWVGEKKPCGMCIQPSQLGAVEAGVSVGGGLIGLAVLALAGYGVYKLVT